MPPCKCKDITSVRIRPLPPKSLRIHLSSIILLYAAIITVSLNNKLEGYLHSQGAYLFQLPRKRDEQGEHKSTQINIRGLKAGNLLSSLKNDSA